MSVPGPRQRIVFFGAGAFGLPTLEALSEAHDLSLVVTQPDRPAGRGRRPAPSPIGAWAAAAVEAGRLTPGQIIKPDSVNEDGVRAQIRAVEADAWVVIAFGQKLNRRLLEDRFAINLHASLLPRWRGAAPINAAILAGDTETGNSVITLADRMDAGLVLGQSRRAIDPELTAGELHDLLAADGPVLMLDVLRQHAEGRLAPVEQDESQVTIAGKLSKADGWVDFRAPAEEVRRRIHGLTPWPGATVQFRGESVKLLRAQALGRSALRADSGRSALRADSGRSALRADSGRSALRADSGRSALRPDRAPGELPDLPPGALLDPEQGLVACGSGGGVRLMEIQPAGGRKMTWEEFARGRRPTRGEQFGRGERDERNATSENRSGGNAV